MLRPTQRHEFVIRLGLSLGVIPRGKSRVVVFVLVLAVLLLADTVSDGPLGRPASAQTVGSSIEFAENSTAPVGRFSAHDQDGNVIRWSLSGPDADRFTIDGGILSFREPPNYEEPQSAKRSGQLANRNVYRVTVEAAGGRHDVAVTVTDVDDAGTVRIDRPQPQVHRPLGAILSDEDDGVAGERWQWARSEDGETWMDIRGATASRRHSTPADEGMYLRATVTYSDRFGSDKTASAVSVHRVEARMLVNAAPSFVGRPGDEVTAATRSVAENTAVGIAVGRPVSATDADDDILFYELLDTPDLEDEGGRARFTIDSITGQIRVGKVLGADAREHLIDDPDEREDEDSTALAGEPALSPDEEAEAEAAKANNSKYVLRVRVSDPSTASATVNVIVEVVDVNEAPLFDENAPTVLRVREITDNADVIITYGDSDTYAVTDQDGDDTFYTYSVSGADGEFLTFNSGGVLSFRTGHKPDYERKSSYSIVIVARSGEGSRSLAATLDVTIHVVDAEDHGEMFLSQRQPQAGNEVHAAVSDPDGGVIVKQWKWERTAEATSECRNYSGLWNPIATSAVYTPRSDDVGRCLRVSAVYTDKINNAADERITGVAEAPVQNRESANAAPRFVVQTERTSRRVAENTPVGQSIEPPVSAHDDDGDLLIYTLGGADAASFYVSRNNGELRTRAPLDYEAQSRYIVVVTATDPSGASTSIPVTINVTDEDDPAQITGSRSISSAENVTAPVGRFGAYDQDGDVIRWSLSGPDADRFTIDGGVLAFREPPNYEGPQSGVAGVSRPQRNVYRVIIEAAGGTHDVMVTVTDVDDAGMVRIDRPQPQVDRPLWAILADEDEGVAGERWQWARSEDGTIWTDIEGATAPMRHPTPADEGMYLRATVTYSDRFGSDKTASAVSANQVEARPLFNAAPSFADQDEDENALLDVSRSVAENTAVGMVIGRPVSATDADDDILFYELLNTPDLEDDDGAARFTIDSLSGQIRVGKELGADAEEREDEDSTSLAGDPALPSDEDAGDAGNSEYVLRVKVSDPSTASATVNVIVTVAEVNEPPVFADDVPTLLRVRENPRDSHGRPIPPVITLENDATPVDAGAFAVTDRDGDVPGPDGYDDTEYKYSVAGADRRAFTVDDAGTLAFKSTHEPDYEAKSLYSITIEATSGGGIRRLTTELDVVIQVLDAEDKGEVLLSQRQPQVGIDIHATVSDPDGNVTITRWVWEQSDETTGKCRNYSGDWYPIAGALSAVHTPRPAGVGRCLRVVATYWDNIENAVEERAIGILEVPARGRSPNVTDPESEGGFVNAAPIFRDQDLGTEGDQSDRTTRTVAENTKAGQSIGDRVSAHDEDDDLLIYTLGGADAAYFGISRNDGQLKTKRPLNYEARNTYTVVVTATDPSGAADSIWVTINITDVDDPAVITVVR